MSDLLATLIDAALPQTQCTKCGYPSCNDYAIAIAQENILYNRCPPGGQEGVGRLAKILNLPEIPLDISRGIERPRPIAIIDHKECIGCTLCIKACPVDAIVGLPKMLHVVINDRCTGCDLCVPPCPVDCIEMRPITNDATGWKAWSTEQATHSKEYFESRKVRLIRNAKELAKKHAKKIKSTLKELAASSNDTPEKTQEVARKKAILEAAMARAKAQLDSN
ncbi:MAG: electron transport complex subunit RsxB [Betaproteobacteria bacterium]